jgi:hypothetical protein
MTRRRNADSGSYEAVGSQKWIVKGIAALAAAAVLYAGASVVRRIDKLETLTEAHEKQLNKLDPAELAKKEHSHGKDPDLEKLERKVDRIENPRPWEKRQR